MHQKGPRSIIVPVHMLPHNVDLGTLQTYVVAVGASLAADHLGHRRSQTVYWLVLRHNNKVPRHHSPLQVHGSVDC